MQLPPLVHTPKAQVIFRRCFVVGMPIVSLVIPPRHWPHALNCLSDRFRHNPQSALLNVFGVSLAQSLDEFLREGDFVFTALVKHVLGLSLAQVQPLRSCKKNLEKAPRHIAACRQ